MTNSALREIHWAAEAHTRVSHGKDLRQTTSIHEVSIRVPHQTEATGTRRCSKRQVMPWPALPPDQLRATWIEEIRQKLLVFRQTDTYIEHSEIKHLATATEMIANVGRRRRLLGAHF